MKNILLFGLSEKEENLIKEKFDDFNFLSADDAFEKNEKLYVFSGLEYEFLPLVAQEFFKQKVQKNDNLTEIYVVFIEKLGENAKIAIDWLVCLKSKFGLKINVQSEINRENLIEEIKFLKTESIKKPKDNNVTIYTDGACSGNPGAGGWGAVLFHGDYRKEFSGFEANTTNNRMEITAVIKALEMLKASCNVELYSDSAYVVNAIEKGWLENWKNSAWIGSDKKQVKNIDLWQRLDELMHMHSVNFHKVKGHADNEFNNRCDQLATGEIAKNLQNH